MFNVSDTLSIAIMHWYLDYELLTIIREESMGAFLLEEQLNACYNASS